MITTLNIAACTLDTALLATSIQVQQPASNEEQRHQQRCAGHDDSTNEPEVTADVQRIIAGQYLRTETAFGIAYDRADLTIGRIKDDGVQRTRVR